MVIIPESLIVFKHELELARRVERAYSFFFGKFAVESLLAV